MLVTSDVTTGDALVARNSSPIAVPGGIGGRNMRTRNLGIAMAASILIAGGASGALPQKASTANAMRGTQESPFFVQGNVTFEKSQTDAQRDAESDKEKATTDVKAVGYSRWTAIFTGLAAAIAFAQMLLFVWQLRLLRKSADDAAKAATAARDSANVAMNTFATLERPWLFLEKHRVERREGAPIQPSLLNNFWISLLYFSFCPAVGKPYYTHIVYL